MKKSTLQSLVAFLNGETVTNIDEIKQELENELSKGAEKAQANRDLYAQAHEVVVKALAEITVPVTAAELYEEICDELPEGFTRGKLSYAMSRMWVDEFERSNDRTKTYMLK